MAATESATVAASTAGRETTNLWARRGYSLCLVLFLLLLAILAGTDIHPDPSGQTYAQQVRAVAESADSWARVHFVLAGPGLLGIGAVLGFRSLIPRSGRLSGHRLVRC